MNFKRRYKLLKKLVVLISIFSTALLFAAFSPIFAMSSQEPQAPDAPNATSCIELCIELNVVSVGNSVEGLGVMHPDLDIQSSGNAVVVADGNDEFFAYRGDGITNCGCDELLNTFSDVEKAHEYTFSFRPGVSADFFSLQMLDYGDYNPQQATEHSVSLLAYDANDRLVDEHELFFTSDGKVNPIAGSAGDLSITGDAATAHEGEPGNYTFAVEGERITRLELQFESNLAVGATDPHFALAVKCVRLHLDPPTAALKYHGRCNLHLVSGRFLVEYACSATAPNLISATINGHDVVNGQLVRLVVSETESARVHDGFLVRLSAPEFSLDVTCANNDGHEVSTSVQPVFGTP